MRRNRQRADHAHPLPMTHATPDRGRDADQRPDPPDVRVRQEAGFVVERERRSEPAGLCLRRGQSRRTQAATRGPVQSWPVQSWPVQSWPISPATSGPAVSHAARRVRWASVSLGVGPGGVAVAGAAGSADPQLDRADGAAEGRGHVRRSPAVLADQPDDPQAGLVAVAGPSRCVPRSIPTIRPHAQKPGRHSVGV